MALMYHFHLAGAAGTSMDSASSPACMGGDEEGGSVTTVTSSSPFWMRVHGVGALRRFLLAPCCCCCCCCCLRSSSDCSVVLEVSRMDLVT